MLSLTASSPSLLFSHYSFPGLTYSPFPSVFFLFGSITRRRTAVHRFAALNLVAVRETSSLLGCYDSLKKGNCYKGLCWGCSGFLRRCRDWDSEGDFSLEAEILEFMKNSKNPEAFPTKEELVGAGRRDLADAIVKKGGWLAFGWDLDDEAQQEGFGEMDMKHKSFLNGNDCEVNDGDFGIDDNENQVSRFASSSSSDDFSQPAMSTGESVEIEAEESGIEGILNRLKKDRNTSLGVEFREIEDSTTFRDNEDKAKQHHRTTRDSVAADIEKSSRPSSLSPANSHLSGFQSQRDQHRSQLGSDDLKNSLRPDMWKSWIIQRNGFSCADFEDAEIAPSETRKGDVSNVSGNDILEIREIAGEPINREKRLGSLDGKANYSDMKSRIQQLESELFSVLHLLRSNADKIAIQTDQKSSSDELPKLYDAWEFQENEIMNAQDRLRSIRAKLAVLEGKMALAIMDAHKIVEEKQKRIDNAHRAMQLLKTTCVVWPNTASEVLLAGSFDGWSTQRKMEKSRTGIFSLCLQLYPGKYEIKFIVDGEWKIDPLRPIVHNNGYENNLLIIHD